MPLPPHLAALESRIRTRFDAAVADLRREYESRLRRSSDEMLAALGDVRPAADPLAGLEAPELEPPTGGASRAEAFAALLALVRALDRAKTQGAALEALLDGARGFCGDAGRAAVLLVRAEGLVGWGGAGFDGDPIAGRELAWDGDLLAGLSEGRGVRRLDAADARRLAERLGLTSPPSAAALVPLVLRDQVAAALYVDARAADALELEGLQLLVAATADRIELQALTERAFSPTLYLVDQAPMGGLPLWGAIGGGAAAADAYPAEPAEPAPIAEPAPPPVWTPAVPAPAWQPPRPPEPEPEPAAPLAAGRSQVEGLFAVAEPEPFEAALPAPPMRPISPLPSMQSMPSTPSIEEAIEEQEPAREEPASTLEDSLWGAESAVDAGPAGFDMVSEPADEPAPPPAFAEPPLGDATVRIPIFRPEPTETAAPVADVAGEPDEIEATTTRLRMPPSSTQEVPRLEPLETTAPLAFGAPPTPAAPIDATEDATVLMRRSGAAPAPAEPEEEPNERTAVRGARTTEVAPPPDVRGPGLAFAAGRTPRPGGENALHEEAKRLARLLVSEIKLYNEEQVLEGRRNRDLYVRLKEDIDRSRQIYDERVHESVRGSTDYFHQELVRSLAGGDTRALGL